MCHPFAAVRLATPVLLFFFVLVTRAAEPASTARLITAISTNNVAEVIAALDQGADPNAKPPGNDTPALVYSASQGLTKIVEALLDKGADVKAARPNGETALILAARGGHGDCVRLLLDKGSDVNAVTEEGFTALMGGAFSGDTAMVETLLARDADVNAQGKLRKVTPLILAVIGKHKEIVKKLLDKGADPSKTDDHGYSALRYAGDMKQQEIVMMLNAAMGTTAAAPPADTPNKEPESKAPAPTAASIEAQLADEPAPGKEDLNQKDADGRTALMRAAMEGRGEKTQNLLNQGVDVNATDNDGWSALTLACFQGNPIIVKLLLEKNANVNATTKRNSTALIIAAGKGHADVVGMLIAAKADVKAKDAAGKTALAYAKDNGHAIVVELLKKSGAKE